MNIELLNSSHIEDAAKMVLDNYKEERKSVNILPLYENYMDIFCKSISGLLNNGIGVAAIHNGRLSGFLTGMAVDSFKGLNRGIYCPIYAHAASNDDKRNIYQRMYEVIAEIWVKNGCLTHAVTMFAHDREAVDTWFWNGFGCRCVDAIRPLTPVSAGALPEYTVKRVTADEADIIFLLEQEHSKYYSRSPLFMSVLSLPGKKNIVEWLRRDKNYLWAAFDGNIPVAYMKVTPKGETFVGDDPEMLNICGAYSVESVRGKGVGALLLSHVINWLSENGYKRCGVDFEAFNRYGSRFWLKHFEPFTLSLVRRLDERILWANAVRTEGIMF